MPHRGLSGAAATHICPIYPPTQSVSRQCLSAANSAEVAVCGSRVGLRSSPQP